MLPRIIACVLLVATVQVAAAQNFAGKALQVLVGYGAGGGTDAAARLVAQYLPHYLPGVPTGIVRNMPGAEGIIASNYFAQQVAPDGLTIMMESSTQADPNIYRKPQSKHDASKFEVIGGIGRGGTVLVLRKEAQPRLIDKQAQPVVMGVTGAVPRSGMQAAAWGVEALGWNVHWVTGYRGTEDLILALERGEIDMTATGNMFQLQKLRDSGKYIILSQSGSFVDGKFVARPDFGGAPLMPEKVGEKMSPGLQSIAFAYWANLTAIDKWLVLPTGTPLELRNLFRRAFAETLKDPKFVEQSKKIGDDFVPMSAEDVETLVQRLAETPPDAIAFIDDMLRKQGLSVEQ